MSETRWLYTESASGALRDLREVRVKSGNETFGSQTLEDSSVMAKREHEAFVGAENAMHIDLP